MQIRSSAFVVGISKYEDSGQDDLVSAVNDANDVASALQELGFSSLLLTDCTAKEFHKSLESFRDNLNSSEVGLFYYAGHGTQIDDQNYLSMADTRFFDEIDAKHSSIPLNQVVEVMAACSNKINLIVLDACRNNPYFRSWNRGAEINMLAPVHSPEGTLIAFACSPGQTAKEGRGRNGHYTEAFLRHLKTPDIPVEDLFKRVRKSLKITTNGGQISWEHTSLTGDYFFNTSPGRRMTDYGPTAIADFGSGQVRGVFVV